MIVSSKCARILYQFLVTKGQPKSKGLCTRSRLPMTKICCLFRQSTRSAFIS